MPYMSFAKTGVTTVTLSRNDSFPRQAPKESGQIVAESEGGGVWVATVRPRVQLFILHWPRMPDADYAALVAFFEHANVNLTANTFAWTDYDSTSRTVRLWQAEQFYAAPSIITGFKEVTMTLRVEVP